MSSSASAGQRRTVSRRTIPKGHGGQGGGKQRPRLEGFDDEDAPEQQRECKRRFAALEARCHLDFEANLEKLFPGETLHKTAEYMRKHG